MKTKSRRLTWDARKQRWRGSLHVGGKRRWFGYPGQDGKTASEGPAYAAFRRWLAQWELAQESPDQGRWRRIRSNLLAVQSQLRRAGEDTASNRELWEWTRRRLDYVSRMILANEPCPVGLDRLLAMQAGERMPDLSGFQERDDGVVTNGRLAVVQLTEEQLRRLAVPPPIEASVPVVGPAPWDVDEPTPRSDRLTVAEAVQRFLADLATTVSPGRSEFLRHATNRLVELTGGVVLAEVTAEHLAAYRASILADERIGDGRRQSLLAVARQFMRWCHDHELIEAVPRLLTSRSWQIRVGPGTEIRALTDEDLARIFGASEGKDRLYWMLMLNTGYLQGDVAELRQEEYSEGRIRRRRSKTARCINVPVVEYLLWPETRELLDRYRSDDETYLLTSVRSSNPRTHRSQIEVRWWAVREAAGVEAPLKLLRKTGATMLASSPVHRGYVEHYLGHAGKTIAAKHYVKVDQAGFDAAVGWLGEQLRAAWGP